MEQQMYSEVSKDLSHKRKEVAPGIRFRRWSAPQVSTPGEAAMLDARAYRRAIERWENEGGATLA